MDEATLDQIQEEAEQQIQEAVEFARESPEPELDAIWTDIFKKPFPDHGSASAGRS